MGGWAHSAMPRPGPTWPALLGALGVLTMLSSLPSLPLIPPRRAEGVAGGMAGGPAGRGGAEASPWEEAPLRSGATGAAPPRAPATSQLPPPLLPPELAGGAASAATGRAAGATAADEFYRQLECARHFSSFKARRISPGGEERGGEESKACLLRPLLPAAQTPDQARAGLAACGGDSVPISALEPALLEPLTRTAAATHAFAAPPVR